MALALNVDLICCKYLKDGMSRFSFPIRRGHCFRAWSISHQGLL